jgi:D-aminopeptidase
MTDEPFVKFARFVANAFTVCYTGAVIIQRSLRMSIRPRARACGIAIGTLPTGPLNAITDVAGVRVGQVTLIEGAGPLVPGVGPVRTGLTAIQPHAGDVFQSNVAAAIHSLNGFGEVTGAMQVREMGVLESPILLTGSFNVAHALDGALEWAMRADPQIGISNWGPSAVVAECSDMYLSDVRGQAVTPAHVIEALDAAAGGPVAEGGVGGGTGMSCCEFKGGIGTSSRVVPPQVAGTAAGYTVGALVMSNFGRREHLVIDGVPVGRELLGWAPPASVVNPDTLGSSIIIVLATDAPLDPRQLDRLAVRAGAGLARAGGLQSTSSGDFVIAFSTTNRVPHHPHSRVVPQHIVIESLMVGEVWPGRVVINELFQAAAEATEEAILNALFAAETMLGRDDHIRHALPIEEVVRLMHQYGHASAHLPKNHSA